MGREVCVMDLVNGRSLESYVEKDMKTRTYKDTKQLLPREARISIVHQIANALEYMWTQNYVHGDVFDRNIMVTRRGQAYNVVLIDFGRTVHFDEVAASRKNDGSIERIDGKAPNDIFDLANICKLLHLEEHAKMFPDSIYIMKATRAVRAYVNEMNLYPERFIKHLMYSERVPAAIRDFLPGLLGYAVCGRCRGTGNLAVELRKSEKINTQQGKINKLNRGQSGRKFFLLKQETEKLNALMELRCQKCASLREQAPTVHGSEEARKNRVYVAIDMWRQRNNTDRFPVTVADKTDLLRYAASPEFQAATRYFTERIIKEDIWKYAHQWEPLGGSSDLVTVVKDLKEYARKVAATNA